MEKTSNQRCYRPARVLRNPRWDSCCWQTGGRLSLTEGYNFLTELLACLAEALLGVATASPRPTLLASSSPELQSPQLLRGVAALLYRLPNLISLMWLDFFSCHVFKYVDLISLTKASQDAKFLKDFYD